MTEREAPKPGEVWRHHEGSLCTVVSVAEHPQSQRRDPRSGRPGPVLEAVTYTCSRSPGRLFYRTMTEWMHTFCPDHRPRFERIEEDKCPVS